MTTINSDTMRGQYASGEGFDAGNRAPSTKYVNEQGEIVDTEPTGIGRVLIAEGDVVHPHIAEAIKAGSQPLVASYDNGNSPGDHSHGNQTPARTGREPLEGDDTEQRKPWAKHKKGELEAEVDARNAARPDDAKIDREGTVKDLAARLDADDAARAGGSDA